jgi:outer membrane protein, heavy metal efflux system
MIEISVRSNGSRHRLAVLIVFVFAHSAAVAQSINQSQKSAAQSMAGAVTPLVQISESDNPRQVAPGNQQEGQNQPVVLNNLPTPIFSRYVDQTGGTTVESLLSQAVQQNRDLLAARQNVAIIRGRLIQAGLRPNPTIDTEYSTDKVSSREGEYGLSLSYIQPIELGGKRAKRRQVAELELQQSEKELAFQERQLAAEIQSQYAEALAAAEVLRATEQLVGLNEQTLRVTQVRLTEGDVAKLDVNLIRVEVNRLRAQQAVAENRVRAALLQIRTLAGLGIDESLKLSGGLASPPPLDGLTLEGLQTASLQSRADLQAARIAEEAADARTSLAEAQAVPDISVFGRYTQDKSIFNNVPLIGRLSEADRKAAVGVSVTLPIFNRNQGGIAEAAAARVQTRHRREFLEQVVKRDVVLAYGRLQTAKETVQIYETEILPGGQENLRMIRTAYDLGDQQVLEVVAEQRRLIEAQQQYIDALKEYRVALVELERAVGARIR